MIASISSTEILIRLAEGAVLGAIAGSFLATLAIRWPVGRSVAVGRSACDHCGAAILAWDLVPILSFMTRSGRCRSCGEKIDPLHMAMEIVAAAIGATAFAIQPGWPGVAAAVFGWTLLVLAVLDLRHFWLPNIITAFLLLSGLIVGAAGLPPTFSDRFIAAASGFLILFAVAKVFARTRGYEGMGGGDPKLVAAIGAWLGWEMLPWVLLGASLAGLAAFVAMKLLGHDVGRQSRMPFGFLLAIVAWPLWFWAS